MKTKILHCQKIEPISSYNQFNIQRIQDLLEKNNTLQNPLSCVMMDSAIWNHKTRLQWIVDSFSELEWDGFKFGDGSYSFRHDVFVGIIKNMNTARMYLRMAKKELLTVAPSQTTEDKSNEPK